MLASALVDRMLDVFEEQCRTQTRALLAAASNGGAEYDAVMAATQVVPHNEALTFFHSRVLPAASVRTLAASLVKTRIAVDLTTVSIAVVLMLRYNATHPVTAHMMHRLFVACVLVGAKAHQDKFPCNKLLGTAVGVKPSEMNRIEWAIIAALDWRLVVTQQDVNEAVVSIAPPPPPPLPPPGGAYLLRESGVSVDSAYVPQDVHCCGPVSTFEIDDCATDEHHITCA